MSPAIPATFGQLQDALLALALHHAAGAVRACDAAGVFLGSFDADDEVWAFLSDQRLSDHGLSASIATIGECFETVGMTRTRYTTTRAARCPHVCDPPERSKCYLKGIIVEPAEGEVKDRWAYNALDGLKAVTKVAEKALKKAGLENPGPVSPDQVIDEAKKLVKELKKREKLWAQVFGERVQLDIGYDLCEYYVCWIRFLAGADVQVGTRRTKTHKLVPLDAPADKQEQDPAPDGAWRIGSFDPSDPAIATLIMAKVNSMCAKWV